MVKGLPERFYERLLGFKGFWDREFKISSELWQWDAQEQQPNEQLPSKFLDSFSTFVDKQNPTPLIPSGPDQA